MSDMKASPKRSINASLCLLFFFLSSGFVFSQAWNPFPGGGTYLYTFFPQPLSDSWLHGVRVDSRGLAGGDSYNSAANTVITGKTATATGLTYTSERDTLIVLRASMQPNDSTCFPPVSHPETFNFADDGFLNLLPYESTPGQSTSDLIMKTKS